VGSALKHYTPFVSLPRDRASKLRTALCGAVFSCKRRQRAAELVFTVLFKGHDIDPIQLEPYSVIMAFRRRMQQSRDAELFHEVWHMDVAAGASRSRRQGPVQQLRKACRALGWRWDSFDHFTRPGLPPLPVAECTCAWFAHEVREACRQAALHEAARRRKIPRQDLRLDGHLDFDASCFLLRGPWSSGRRREIRDRVHARFGRLKEPYVHGILKNVLVGALWTGVRLAKAGVIESEGCLCGHAREDACHIFWHCPRWDTVRVKYGFTAAWRRQQHWTFLRTGLQMRSAELDKHLNLSRPWRPPAAPPRPALTNYDKENVEVEEGFALWFTDGGSLSPTEPLLRRAGSGGWLRSGHPCNFSVPVDGPIQTNNEAEAFAMLVVASWMWRPTKIVSDSEWAVTRLQSVLAPGGFDIDVGTWDHPAIWRSIQTVLRSLPAGVRRVDQGSCNRGGHRAEPQHRRQAERQ
jgi:ribonuclease HI